MSVLSDLQKFLGSIDPTLLAGRGRAQPRRLQVVIVGAGAVGGTVGAWLAMHHDNVHFHDLPAMNARLRREGITVYPQGERAAADTVSVRVLDDLAMAPEADIVVLAVKNYHLETVAGKVQRELGDRPVILALQNGLVNQTILPRYFSRVVYGVVSYNAWIDPDGAIGYQKRGPLHVGTRKNELPEVVDEVARLFSLGVPTHGTDRLGDAAHAKLVINLTNSLTTLIGLNVRPISDEGLFQRLLTNQLHEGVQVVKAAGYRECRLGGMPSWAIVAAGAKLPQALTRGLFQRNVKKMVMSSMAQDVLVRREADTELETLNGYLLSLARKYGVATPYNDVIYAMCRREFARPDFAPLDVRDVFAEVHGAQRGSS